MRVHFPFMQLCGAAGEQSDANSDELHGALWHSSLCVSESNGSNHQGQSAGHPQARACTAVLLHSSSPQLSTGTCQPVMAPAVPTAPHD